MIRGLNIPVVVLSASVALFIIATCLLWPSCRLEWFLRSNDPLWYSRIPDCDLDARAKIEGEPKADWRGKRRLLKWRQLTLQVHHTQDGRIEDVDARRTLYATRSFATPVTAFATRSGKVWAGPEQQFYIETESNVTGGSILCEHVQWCECLIDNRIHENDNIDEVIEGFEKEVSASKLDDIGCSLGKLGTRETELGRSGLSPEFFEIQGKAAGNEMKTFRGIQVAGNMMKLDLRSNDGKSVATAWIDIPSKKLSMLIENGKQVFPK